MTRTTQGSETTGPQINPHVFREYDIRGVADRDLGDDFTQSLGQAIGTLLRGRGAGRVAVGRDVRPSSPRLREALVAGLRRTGLDVVDIGEVPTPLLYFAVWHLDLDGGVQITGSHNPSEDNGFKMMTGKASLFGEDIQTLRRSMESGDLASGGLGTVEEVDLLPAYVGYLRGNMELGGGTLRFAVDAGNGVAGPAALAAMRALGLDPIPLLCEPDGRFPVHHPDPSQPENLELLRQTIADEGIDLGIAFDGDGDRIGVLDAKGEVLFGDKLLALFARDLLERRPGATVIGEVKCSQTLYDDIAARGGRPIMWKTGHSLIKTKMKEEGALLAGEVSGHMFFADRYYGFDDAIYAALRLIELLSRSDQPLHALLKDLPVTHTTPEIRVACPDATKFAVVDQVREHFAQTREVVAIDGARIRFDEGWGLVRASNTQPVLVLRFEASSPMQLATIRAEVERAVERAKVAVDV
ncbi:MAG TPA: phosphomannomutase/phosphoglucomutase [Polyangiaceae bacterium LLY-WYZ-14_1]|nr:phosphomannomutase/phosphoglucomutase [Polyangiaceae bacterium LLY-WYZ-14_1]